MIFDQFGRQYGLLGDVHGRVAGPVHALGDDGAVQAHWGQFECVGVGVRVDRLDLADLDDERAHGGLLAFF